MELRHCLLQLISYISCKVNCNVGLSLSGDSTHILSALNRAVVGTADKISRLPSGNSSDVIAHMIITDISVVDTPADNADRNTGDSSNIRDSDIGTCFIILLVDSVL